MASVAALVHPLAGTVASGTLILIALFIPNIAPMVLLPACAVAGWVLAIPLSYPIAARIVGQGRRSRAGLRGGDH